MKITYHQYEQPSQHLLHHHYTYNHYQLNRIHEHLQTLFSHYAKVTAIRLDLYVQSEFVDMVTAKFMMDRWTQFRNNIRFNQLFEYFITYVMKLEYGEKRGWHLHVALFFDGHYVQQDATMAKLIGDYWQNVITRGIGSAYSRNLAKESVEVCPLGMISYHDTQRIEQLEQVLAYLAKEENIPCHMVSNGEVHQPIRRFNMGRIKPKRECAGRPRIHETR